MKKHAFALAALATAAALPAIAQTTAEAAIVTPAAAAEAHWAFTANVGLFSDYRFRGISQTDKKPALQGGFDLGHSSGLYIGNWNSNIDSAYYNGANIEMDFYGGYKHAFDGGFGLDVGVITYDYPNSGSNPSGSMKIDNTELYIGGAFGPVTLKYNYAVSDYFSAPDSSGSSYLDAGFSHDLGHNFGVVAHVGYQWLNLDSAVGRARAGCDAVRRQGATTLRATARKEEQRRMRAAARLDRVRSALTQRVNVVVRTKLTDHAV